MASSSARGRIRSDIMKNFFSEGVIKHWNRMSRDMVKSSSLEGFKKCVDMAVKDMV